MDRLDQYQATGGRDDTVRVLQAFLDNLPADGKQNLQTDIDACRSDDQIRAHAKCLVDGLLYPLKRRSITPSMATSPVLPFRDATEIKPPEVVDGEARLFQLKTDCLKRDGYRCLVSKVADSSISLDQDDGKTLRSDTQCAHIVPYCLSTWDTDADRDVKAEIWANLNRCFPSLWSKLHFTQDNIDDHRNALTLFPIIYDHFRRFELALERTDVKHRYKIQHYRRGNIVQSYFPRSGFVSFRAVDSRFELPSPELLEFHASICRILHASGKAGQADKIRRDQARVETLAGDGSTDIASMLAMTSLGVLSSRASRQHSTDSPGALIGEED